MPLLTLYSKPPLLVFTFITILYGVSAFSLDRVPGHAGFIPDFRPNLEFFQPIRDWFNDMKSRLMGQFQDPTLQAKELFSNIANLHQKLDIVNNFFLDLTNLKFDPIKDWGFRIGKWYFIRKDSKKPEIFNNNDSEDWSFPDESIEAKISHKNMLPTGYDRFTTSTEYHHSSSTIELVTETTEVQNYSTEFQDDENETDSGKHSQSAEVLMV